MADAERPAVAAQVAATTHTSVIHQPETLTSLQTGQVDARGAPISVPCVTCHSLREDSELPSDESALGLPHLALQLRHGELACAACHAPDAPTSLRLADGRQIPMSEALSLCSQCHGPQRRDYDHGAHGGMRGYWDLGRGPRERNHCVDCHDPHAPAFPQVMPAPAPRDRFLSGRRP